jgi:hypothetical protein
MPDDTIRVLFVKQSNTEEVHGWHLWDNDAETYSHDVVTWNPKCAFQDDLGDIWIGGVDYDLAAEHDHRHHDRAFQAAHQHHRDQPLQSRRSTSPACPTLTTRSPIPSTEPRFGAGARTAISSAGGSRRRSRWRATATPMTGTCDYLLKLNLADNTDKTITDISGPPRRG